MLDHRTLDDVRDAIASPEDFYDPRHATIFQAIESVVEKDRRLDMVLLSGKLLDMGVLNDVGGVEYLTEMFDSVPNAMSAGLYAERVADKALRRRLIEKQEASLKSLYDSDGSACGIIDSQVNQLIEMRPADRTTEGKVDTWLDEALDEDRPRIHSGMQALDDIVGGFEMGTMTVVGARPSMGKAQPLDAKVLTEAGWARMGDLDIGDRLASVDGGESVVTGVFPQGKLKINRITLSDGRTTRCCDEHLWRVMHREWEEARVITTARLKEMLGSKRYRNRLYVEQFTGEYGIDRMLPIDPWLLGFLLGDGGFTGGSIRFSTSCEATVDRVRKTVGSFSRVTKASKYDYRIVTSEHRGFDGRFSTSPLMLQLRRLGLWGKSSYQKWIPKVYLDSTREQRAALLCGLIDSDGWVEKSGSVMFGTTSHKLARGVTELVRSLGGYCKNSTKQPFFTYKGERKEGRTFYKQSIQLDQPRLYCKCPKKLERMPEQYSRKRRLNVVSIEECGEAEAQCISVSHPSRLYVTDDFIVTHNTAWGVCAAINMVSEGVPVGFVSAEMKGRRIARRMVCAEAQMSTEEFEKDKHSPETMGIVEEIKQWPLWIDETSGMPVDRVCSRIRRWHREHGIQAAIVDYLQLLDTGKETEYDGVTFASKRLKALAQELDIALFVLAQLNRGNVQRNDKRPTMADLRGSGAVEQDADVILMLHRESYYASGTDILEGKVKEDEAEILVEKSRDGRTGTATVGWLGKCGVFGSGVVGTFPVGA